jgi:hypothetical protein
MNSNEDLYYEYFLLKKEQELDVFPYVIVPSKDKYNRDGINFNNFIIKIHDIKKQFYILKRQTPDRTNYNYFVNELMGIISSAYTDDINMQTEMLEQDLNKICSLQVKGKDFYSQDDKIKYSMVNIDKITNFIKSANIEREKNLGIVDRIFANYKTDDKKKQLIIKVEQQFLIIRRSLIAVRELYIKNNIKNFDIGGCIDRFYSNLTFYINPTKDHFKLLDILEQKITIALAQEYLKKLDI